MLQVAIASLVSIILAWLFSRNRVKLTAGRHSISSHNSQFIYFLPIWILIAFRWNVTPIPDTTYGTGSYSQYYKILLNGGSLVRTLFDEPLFWAISKFFALLNTPWVIYLGIFGTIFVVSNALYFKTTSTSPGWSMFFLCAAGTLTFAMSSLRQVLSISFLLYAYHIYLSDDSISKKDWTKILISLFLGGLCHLSCMLLIPVFLISKIRINKDIALFVLIALIIFNRYIGSIINILLRLTRYSRRLGMGYDAHNFAITYVLLGLGIIVLMRVFYEDYSRTSKCADSAFNFMLCYELIMIMSGFLVDAYRLTHCFTPLFAVELPRVFDAIKKRSTRLAVEFACCVVFCVIFYFYTDEIEYATLFPLLPEILSLR